MSSDSKEVEEAKRVLRAAYYQKVSNEVEDLVRAYFDGEYDDVEGQDERLNEACDSHVTYTHDAYETIAQSENSSDGYDMMRDATGPDLPDNDASFVTRWAYFTFQSDVLELLGNSYGAAQKLLPEPLNDGLDSDERLVWLVEHFGTVLLEEPGDDLTVHFYVGIVDHGTATEVDLGLVTIEYDGPDTHHVKKATRRSVPSKFDEITGPNRDARDPGTMTVLRDALLDSGYFVEKSSTPATATAKPEHISLAKRDLANRGYHVLRGSRGSGRARIFVATDVEDPNHPLNPIGFILDLDNEFDTAGNRLTSWTEAMTEQWEPMEPRPREELLGAQVGIIRMPLDEQGNDLFDLPVYEYDL